MGLSDVAPNHAPEWLVLASTACLGAGSKFFFNLVVLLHTELP